MNEEMYLFINGSVGVLVKNPNASLRQSKLRQSEMKLADALPLSYGSPVEAMPRDNCPD